MVFMDEEFNLHLYWWMGGRAEWAKIKVHSTWIKQIHKNGQIYAQNIDSIVILDPLIKQTRAK